jgi:hypothetical protein
MEPRLGGGYTLFQPGWYKMIIAGSEIKPTRNQGGTLLSLKLQCIEGQMQGRTLDWTFNINNSSQQAVEIAYKELHALGWVLGKGIQADTSEWHNIPFGAYIENRPLPKRETDPPNTPPQMSNDIVNLANMQGQEWKAIYEAARAGAAPQGQAPAIGGVPQQQQPQTQTPAQNGPSFAAPGSPQGGFVPPAQPTGFAPQGQPVTTGAPSFAAPGGTPGFQPPGGAPAGAPGTAPAFGVQGQTAAPPFNR